jgi:hypothetical protein
MKIVQHCCKKKHLALKRAARKGGSLLSMNDYSLFLHLVGSGDP